MQTYYYQLFSQRNEQLNINEYSHNHNNKLIKLGPAKTELATHTWNRKSISKIFMSNKQWCFVSLNFKHTGRLCLTKLHTAMQMCYNNKKMKWVTRDTIFIEYAVIDVNLNRSISHHIELVSFRTLRYVVATCYLQLTENRNALCARCCMLLCCKQQKCTTTLVDHGNVLYHVQKHALNPFKANAKKKSFDKLIKLVFFLFVHVDTQWTQSRCIIQFGLCDDKITANDEWSDKCE